MRRLVARMGFRLLVATTVLAAHAAVGAWLAPRDPITAVLATDVPTVALLLAFVALRLVVWFVLPAWLSATLAIEAGRAYRSKVTPPQKA